MKSLILFLLLLVPGCIYSQEMKVKEARLLQDDLAALDNPVVDINGNQCALLKIDAGTLEGLTFPDSNQYVKTGKVGNEYYVYVPGSFYKLKMQQDKYLPLEVNFKEQFGIRFRSGSTYYVKLDVPTANKELLSDVYINVRPKQADLYLNNELQSKSSDGNYKFQVEAGNYNYLVKADNYHWQSGNFTIANSSTKVIPVTLKPMMVPVSFKCPTEDSELFIDDVYYGELGNQNDVRINVPKGSHQVRVMADGYIPYQKTLTLDATTATVDATLQKNANRHDIHAVPIKIITKYKHIYKNNKLIKEKDPLPNGEGWIIYLMPGKYMISFPYWSKVIQVIENQPQTIQDV